MIIKIAQLTKISKRYNLTENPYRAVFIIFLYDVLCIAGFDVTVYLGKRIVLLIKYLNDIIAVFCGVALHIMYQGNLDCMFNIQTHF